MNAAKKRTDSRSNRTLPPEAPVAEIGCDFSQLILDLAAQVSQQYRYARFYEAKGFADPDTWPCSEYILSIEMMFWNPKNTAIKLFYVYGEEAVLEFIESPWPNFRKTIYKP